MENNIMYMIDCALMKEFNIKPSCLSGVFLKDLYMEQKYLLALFLESEITFSSVGKAIFINKKDEEFEKIFSKSLKTRSTFKAIRCNFDKKKANEIINGIKEKEKIEFTKKALEGKYGIDYSGIINNGER